MEFDTLLMEVRLLKDKLKKAMDEFAKILKGENSTTHEELESLVGLFLLRPKLFVWAEHFSDVSMMD